jgi:hypothetical protein
MTPLRSAMPISTPDKRQHPDDPVVASLLSHLSFWFGLVFAAPLFIALRNPEDVTFAASQFAGWSGGLCLLLTLLGWQLSRLAGPRVRWWLNRTLLGAAFVMALQSNVVHDLFYYGAFNGERVDFRAYGSLFWVEWAAWLLAFPVAVWLIARFRRLPAWLPALPIVSFALLLAPDLMYPRENEPTRAEAEVAESVFAFSSVRNLIHLLPDGFQGDFVREVFETNPDLAARFDGFALYTDHVGMYQGTAPAVYSMLTGKAFDFERGFSYDWVRPDVQANSYQNELADAGYQIDYVPISSFICIKSAQSCHARPFNDMKSRGYNRHRAQDAFYSLRLIADLTLFRLAPMFLKEKIHDEGQWFFADTTLDGSSPWPDPVIREWTEKLHIVNDRPVYKWYHYIGTHIPARWDADCRFQPEVGEERADYLAQATCVLNGIAKFLERLREAGIYDQSAILITGDHGGNTLPDDVISQPLNSDLIDTQMGAGRPTLLVKRLDSRGPLQFSQRPTHFGEIAGTALSLVGIGSQQPSIFEVPERRAGIREFRRYSVPKFWTGEPIAYVEYGVGQPARDAGNWAISGIQDYREAPTAYDPVNFATGNGFIMGAHLRQAPDNTESSWISGRQLAFVIDLPGPPQARTLEISMHFPEWMPGQSFTVALNRGEPWRSPTVSFDAESFWQEFSIPLAPGEQTPGRNFVSVVFDQLYVPPETDSWRSSGLIRSIHVAEPSAAR